MKNTICKNLKRDFHNGKLRSRFCILYKKNISEDICNHCCSHSKLNFDKYRFSLNDFSKFANDYGIPLFLIEKLLFFKVYAFKEDKSIIKKLLFSNLPFGARIQEYYLDNNGDYSQESLIKRANSNDL